MKHQGEGKLNNKVKTVSRHYTKQGLHTLAHYDKCGTEDGEYREESRGKQFVGAVSQ